MLYYSPVFKNLFMNYVKLLIFLLKNNQIHVII